MKKKKDLNHREIEERVEKRRERVVVGLSGGVDSSVAAARLKAEGYDVVGLFMVNWHDTVGTLSGECPWEDDRLFAELVAKRLDIPFRMVDLSEQYRERVVDYMFSEYEKGRTPNPDVLCNREIKFDAFLKEALKLGADWVATGHYCRVEHCTDGTHRLLAGVDGNKDQSYFLCGLTQEQLSRALFPVGDMLKGEVRAAAAELHLATAKRKDSQGICFVGKVDLPLFLQQKLAAKKGRIIEISSDWEGYRNEAQNGSLVESEDLLTLSTPYQYTPADGKKVGTHSGAHFYTIGQRHGLGVGGTRLPLFVIATDVVRNIVYVGQGHDHPGLLRSALRIRPEEMHWVREDKRMQVGDAARRYRVRIRYRQPLQDARLFVTQEGGYLLFDEPQRGITPGQFAAWYEGDELVGSGVIER